MTNTAITQSQKRLLDSLAALFHQNQPVGPETLIFLKSSSDIGVERNGGRNGARLAPQSFLSYFKKLNQKPSLVGRNFREIEVSSQDEEKINFAEAQKNESAKIKKILGKLPFPFFCHLGGGHDHIYPLLCALAEQKKKIVVLNIDAHADTRTDENAHSGTPFRQFAHEYKNFSLFQIGLHEFANSDSTISPLPNGDMAILWKHEISNQQKRLAFFQKIHKHIDAETIVLFSLDADALEAHEMPGVSAVNGNGITRNELTEIWNCYRDLPFSHRPMLGIYELNPVYDTLSMTSIRTLATFVYEIIE